VIGTPPSPRPSNTTIQNRVVHFMTMGQCADTVP
jgi:hypothetical protein